MKRGREGRGGGGDRRRKKGGGVDKGDVGDRGRRSISIGRRSTERQAQEGSMLVYVCGCVSVEENKRREQGERGDAGPVKGDVYTGGKCVHVRYVDRQVACLLKADKPG